MKGSINAIKLIRRFIEEYIEEGAFCIDATAGRGYDTVFLAKLVGPAGKVLAFDIQEEAIVSTKSLLIEERLENSVQVIQDSHIHMNHYAEAETVDCITFNFGYLPGGNHTICTQAETSIKAIEVGLRLLKRKGIMTLCIYHGGDSGFEEKNALMAYLKTIDSKKYIVLVNTFYNRPNNPPIPVFIIKE